MIFIRTIRCDFARILSSGRTYLCLVIMSAITFLSFLDGQDFDLPASAFYFAMNGTDSQTYLLSLIFGFLIYGGCYIDDFQSMNVRHQLMRTRLSIYVASKTFSAYICSIVSFVLSFLIAGIVLSVFKDWTIAESYDFVVHTEFGFLYEKGYYLAYGCIVAFEWGLLSGMLTAFCQYISLYIYDKVLCASMTFVLAFCLNYISVQIDAKQTFLTYFHAMSHRTSNYSGIILCIVISVLVMIISGVLCMIRIRKRVSNE